MARVEYIIYMMSLMLSAMLTALPAYAEGRLYQRVPHIDGMESDGFTAYEITRTDDGFIWFATDHGLVRFDGEHGVRMDLPNSNTGEPSVMTLVPVSDRGLIAATTSGVFRIANDGRRHTATRLLDGEIFRATCAARIPDKVSLIGGYEGILAFTPDGRSRRIMVGRDMLDLSNKVVDMAPGKEGVYVLTKEGVFLLDTDNLAVNPVGDSSDMEALGGTSLAVAGGNIYIGTSGNGIWRMDPVSGKVKEAFSFTKGNVVTSMKPSEGGSVLYVGTDGGGITKIDVASEMVLNHARHVAADPVSPSSNQVYSLFVDQGDNLWVGYYQNGVDYTPSWTGPFELVDDPSVFNTRGVPVRALSISDGRITIGTRDGITVFERNCSTAWSVRNPTLRSEMVLSLLDHNGKTYIGTYGGGLQMLDPVSRNVSDFPVKGPHSVFESGHIFSLAADSKGNLWGGTNHGLFRKDTGGKVTQYTSSDSGLPEGNVYCIFFDSEGKGWICTEAGLCVYDPRQDKLRTDLFPASFPKNTRFRTVYEDSRHRLYFVPEQGMVISSNPDLSEVKTFRHPLLDGADAKGVVEDKAGNIWIATNRGIFRVDSHGHVVRFGLASGLPSPSFLQGQPVSDSRGHIWFGNSAGLLRLTESEINRSIEAQRAPMPTVIKVNGKPMDFIPQREASDGSYRIRLDKSSNTVKIGFSTLSFALEEPDAFLYSLDGGEWQRLASDMSVTLYELSPGNHELRVKSANDVEGDDEMTKLKLKVPFPMWWYLAGMLIVILAGSLAGIWGLYRYRRNKLLQEEVMRKSEDEKSQQETHTEGKTDESTQKRKYASNTLTRNEGREIARKIEEVMVSEKPYLKSDLKVGDLAEMVGVSSHRLSQFFSQHKQQTFYDYVNSFRVEEFKRVAKKNSNLTLSAMAEEAGFSSRASFFRYFKNAEGISPGEWLKKLGEMPE